MNREELWQVPSPVGWALIGFFGIVAFFLLTEHRAHFFGALPWLLLLACPLSWSQWRPSLRWL